MKNPLDSGIWIELDQIESTQSYASETLKRAHEAPVGVVFAHHQSEGSGRFDRTWYSERDHSLTMSLIFHEYANHPKPWLVGMSVALAVAGSVHCRVSWPNDLMLEHKKVGGILTHLVTRHDGQRVPVVGVGLNLSVAQFPYEIESTAGNLAKRAAPVVIAREILGRLALLPDPNDWADLHTVWANFDETPGKKYKLPSGEIAIAIGIGPDGELIAAVDGETMNVLAADALLPAQD